MLWEWIAATVQAIHWNLAMELNRGGPVAAISISSVRAVSSTPVSRAHCFAVWCVYVPPTPHPKCNALVLQLQVNEYGGGWVCGIDAETDCGNRAGHQIFIGFFNARGPVAAMLFHRFVMFGWSSA